MIVYKINQIILKIIQEIKLLILEVQEEVNFHLHWEIKKSQFK